MLLPVDYMPAGDALKWYRFRNHRLIAVNRTFVRRCSLSGDTVKHFCLPSMYGRPYHADLSTEQQSQWSWMSPGLRSNTLTITMNDPSQIQDNNARLTRQIYTHAN